MGLNALVYIESAELIQKISESVSNYEISLWQASDITELIEIVNNTKIDIIFVDEKLKNSEGFKKAKQIHEEKIPVFVFSKEPEEYLFNPDFKKDFLKTLKEGMNLSVLPLKVKTKKFSRGFSEKRKFPRLNIKIPVKIYYEEENKVIEGFIRNICAGGISANLKENIREGKVILKFFLGKFDLFSPEAEKIRTEKMPDHFHIAFKFTKIDEKEKEKLIIFSQRVKTLGKMPIFAQFSDDELYLVAGLIKEVNFIENSVIFSEGVSGRSLYVIKTGVVKIVKNVLSKGKKAEKLLAILRAGDFFGEMALLMPIKRTATAVALKDCILFKISRDDFENHLMSNKDISLKLYRNFVSALIERLKKANQELIDSPFHTPEIKF